MGSWVWSLGSKLVVVLFGKGLDSLGTAALPEGYVKPTGGGPGGVIVLPHFLLAPSAFRMGVKMYRANFLLLLACCTFPAGVDSGTISRNKPRSCFWLWYFFNHSNRKVTHTNFKDF